MLKINDSKNISFNGKREVLKLYNNSPMKLASSLRVLIMSLVIIILFFIFSGAKKYCLDCNVILISIDTLRADRLGAYGYNKNTSPNIDKFAKESTVFTNFYATAPWTLPSHASMFASDYPSQLKEETVFDYLPKKTLTIAKVLQNKGYFTYGFDSNTYVSPQWNFAQGFMGYTLERVNSTGVDANIIFPHAQDWLEKNKDKKFFLFVHTFEVHDPYCPPKPYANKFSEEKNNGNTCVTNEMIFDNIRGKKKLTESELQGFSNLYDGEVAFTDSQVGNLLDLVKKLKLDKKTIIIITSDHGEEFGEHGTWGRHAHTLYNELVKVPLMIKIPGLAPSKNPLEFSMIDIPPTILDLLGLLKPKEFKGISVRDGQKNRPVFFELSDLRLNLLTSISAYNNGLIYMNPTERKGNIKKLQIGVVLNGWKLIKSFAPKKIELYNVFKDAKESVNLISTEKAKTHELEQLLDSHFGKISGENKDNSDTNDSDDLNKLRSLGY